MKGFSGKIALVTGTTGIGRAVAKRFAEAGASVLACGIEPAGNEDLIKEATKPLLPVLMMARKQRLST